MRPYNTYRYTGKEGQNLSQACCSYLNPSTDNESTVDTSAIDLLQSLIQPIDTVAAPIAFDVPVSPAVQPVHTPQTQYNEPAQEPKQPAHNLETAPKYWSFDEPTPIVPRNACRPQLRRAESNGFREPPVLARVPQYADFEQQAVPEIARTTEPSVAIDRHSEIQQEKTSSINELSVESAQPEPVAVDVESAQPEPLSIDSVAEIEKMDAVSPFSNRNAQSDRWIQFKAFAGRLVHDDSFKLMTISCLMVALVLGSVSYKMSRDGSSATDSPVIVQTKGVQESATSSEAAVNSNLAASDQKTTDSKPFAAPSSNYAADTQTPIETSVVVNQVSGESVSGINNVTHQSFTEQMRQESQEDYISPEIFSEESVTSASDASFAANQTNTEPAASSSLTEMDPAAAVNTVQDNSVRRLPPPPAAQTIAQTAPVAPAIASSAQAETVQNGSFNRNMDTQAPLNAYGTQNSSDMYSFQAPQNQSDLYSSAESDSYVSPTLGDDSVEDVQVPSYTALNPANQVR